MQPLTVEPVSLQSEKFVYENSRLNFTDTKHMLNHVILLRFISPILLQTSFIQWNNLSTPITKSITIHLCIVALLLAVVATSLAANA